MKLFIPFVGLFAGGAATASPFLFSSDVGLFFSRDWTRKVSSKPIMICETQDNKKDKYSVNLVFQEGWSSSEEDFSQEDALNDLVFDFVNVKTGESVNQLGLKYPTGEKFQLVITGVSGRNTWGVALQTKLGHHVSQSGDWTSLDCSANNLIFEGEECKTAYAFCNQTEDFKEIKFSYDEGNKKTSGRKISRGIVIASGGKLKGKLKWKGNFKPEAVFSR